MRTVIPVLAAVITFSATACASEGTAKPPEITAREVSAFKLQVQRQVPHMRSFTKDSDFKDLANAICTSLKSGQTYARVSKTTGAYINQPVSSGVVDDVIALAVQKACPEARSKL